jgi:hypothetical protein
MNKYGLHIIQPLCQIDGLAIHQKVNSTCRMRMQNCGGEVTLIRLFYVYLRKYTDVYVCKRLCN